MIDEPKILLMDKAMVGIDIYGRKTIYDSLVKLWQEKNQTIILVSHKIGEVCKRIDKTIDLNKR